MNGHDSLKKYESDADLQIVNCAPPLFSGTFI